jgi:hypothetical protein
MIEDNNDHWELAFSSTQLYKIEILKALLLEADIPATVLNKQDSSYISFGEIELYVKRDDLLKAMQIIDKFSTGE